MEKRRVRLEINGVVCGLITEESEEYMQTLADEVGELMSDILGSSPYITREAAALTSALSYCDDLKKAINQVGELKDRVDELEVEADIWQEDKEKLLKDSSQNSRADELSAENGKLTESLNTLKAEQEGLREKNREFETENGKLSESLNTLKAELEALKAENRELERENEKLRTAAPVSEEAPPARQKQASAEGSFEKLSNPLRHDELDREGLVSFFEKNKNDE